MSSLVESMRGKVGLDLDGSDPMTEIPEIQIVNPRYAGRIRRYLSVDKSRFESELQSSLLSISLWMSAPRVGGQIVDQIL